MSILFEEGLIGSMEVSNRFVRSATSERMGTADGFVTDRVVDMYGALADGGVGLIITGHVFVHPHGKANPNMLGVDNEDKIEGLKRITDRVHQTKSKIVANTNVSLFTIK